MHSLALKLYVGSPNYTLGNPGFGQGHWKFFQDFTNGVQWGSGSEMSQILAGVYGPP